MCAELKNETPMSVKSRSPYSMSRKRPRISPVIITVAIIGSAAPQEGHPAASVAPAKHVESIHEAFEAGATLVHVRVRTLTKA